MGELMAYEHLAFGSLWTHSEIRIIWKSSGLLEELLGKSGD
jgi:hypothetical protein